MDEIGLLLSTSPRGVAKADLARWAGRDWLFRFLFLFEATQDTLTSSPLPDPDPDRLPAAPVELVIKAVLALAVLGVLALLFAR